MFKDIVHVLIVVFRKVFTNWVPLSAALKYNYVNFEIGNIALSF